MTEVVLAALVVLAAIALIIRNLFSSIIVLGVFSLLTALLFYNLHAPDLAVAEAAVAGGLATALFVWAAARTESGKE